MGKNSYTKETDSSEPSATRSQGSRRHSALHIILGLALLFLAGSLLMNMMRKLQQTGLGFTALVSLLGFILFCIVGVMLLVGELRVLFKHIAEKRQSRRSVDHGHK